MDPQNFSFEQQAASAAEFLRTLGNAHRLQVLCLLAEQGEMSVGQILERGHPQPIGFIAAFGQNAR